MSGKEDASAGGANGSQEEPCQLANSGRMYCRSSSWLSSRTSLPPLNPDIEKDGLNPNGVAKDKDMLKQNGITHVLDCVGFVCPEYFKSDFVCQTLWLRDSLSEDITSILYDVFDYFEDVREQHGRVFVHCYQGISRSTSLVIGYLMWREGQSFDDAFEYVKAVRGIADPNIGFACQLLKCQKGFMLSLSSPSSLLRMYRVAPHSPYDPLHLIPKMLNDPSLSALDSIGAFIIHIPSSIYVWIGKKSEAIMERDARRAVCQIVRYEKVQRPIITVVEGEEPLYFWDAFSNFLPLMDKLKNGEDAVESSTKVCPGERKVDTYNIDFEIFQISTSGGFIPPFASCETEYETHLPVRESSWSMLRGKFLHQMVLPIYTNIKCNAIELGGIPYNFNSTTMWNPPLVLGGQASNPSSR
ncbi:Protein-tyrosine-phosphatase MKP1 [Capsicum annuum]|nr:Protein-tyrosine-phosphatase MKP1 [Capsicum annuum]